jgi:integrase
MLIDSAHRYIELRQSLGFKVVAIAQHVTSFATYADQAGDTHIRCGTAVTWAEALSSTQDSFCRRLRSVALFARFLHAEDSVHELPQHSLYYRAKSRPAPYIYTPDEIERILEVARGLLASRRDPLRPHTYEMLFGLLATTGLRISEATGLQLGDVLPDGVLHIRMTKFNKSRLVPLHPSVKAKLDSYLLIRAKHAGCEDRLFLTECGRPLTPPAARATFNKILNNGRIGKDRPRKPRVHDLRHTFATRALERCGGAREEVARDFIALSTYLGHGHIRHTYWYLQATPHLMADVAAMAETFFSGRDA